MADVIVTLSLTRKSGILAAAVSSLARNGLEFKSHRFVDLDDADALQVELMADGEVEDKDALTEVLERIRGVDTVTDIREDGRSLLHDLPAEDEEAEAEPEPEPEPVEAVEEVPAPAAPEPDPEPLPESRVFAEAEMEEGAEGKAEGDSDADESGSGRDDDSGKNPMRRSMMRRRRRFT